MTSTQIIILTLFRIFKYFQDEEELYKLLLLHSFYTGQSFCIKRGSDIEDAHLLISSHIQSQLSDLLNKGYIEYDHDGYSLNLVEPLVCDEAEEYYQLLTKDYDPSKLIEDRCSLEYRSGDTLKLINKLEQERQQEKNRGDFYKEQARVAKCALQQNIFEHKSLMLDQEFDAKEA